MAFSSRSLPASHSRHTSISGNFNISPAGQPLQARVNEKRAELESLRQLRDLSAAVSSQMEALQQKLATLSNGTEAIATVVANWHNVLRAINMASSKLPKPRSEDQSESEEACLALPQTLVRIPTEHAPALQAQTEAVSEDEGGK